MIHIAIVKDEPLYVNQLKGFIHRYQQERGKQIKLTVFRDGEDITENYQRELFIPKEIARKSIGVDGDIAFALDSILIPMKSEDIREGSMPGENGNSRQFSF